MFFGGVAVEVVDGAVAEVGDAELAVGEPGGEDGDAVGEEDCELFDVVLGCSDGVEDVEGGGDVGEVVFVPDDYDGLAIVADLVDDGLEVGSFGGFVWFFGVSSFMVSWHGETL